MKHGDTIEIHRGLEWKMCEIERVYSNGSFALNVPFLGRKKIYPGADYTTKGFRVGYLGTKDGREVFYKVKEADHE